MREKRYGAMRDIIRVREKGVLYTLKDYNKIKKKILVFRNEEILHEQQNKSKYRCTEI